MRRALVTGATGYIGRRLAERLLAEGVAVHALTRKGGRPCRARGAVAHAHDGTTASMLKLVERAAPDVVFHLAALCLGAHRPEDVSPLVASNVLLGAQLAEACVAAGVGRLVNTGSFWQHYEGRPYSPTTLYAATKQAFDDVLRFYAEATALKTVTLELFDVYGPEDPRGRLLALLEGAQRSGRQVKLSPGRQQADFTYVDDVVEAYLHAARLLETSPGRVHGKAWAVRTESTHTVREFVALFEKVTGAPVPVEWGGRPYRPREVMKPWRGPVLPGWKAKVALEDGLRRSLGALAEAARG